MNRDYKAETLETYNSISQVFDRKFEEHFYVYCLDLADDFLASLNGRRILDLGSGSGIASEYFLRKGYSPLCFDNSEGMLELCNQKGLVTCKGDIEELDLPELFDGIWAYASLLHIPKKNLISVIERVRSHLNPFGKVAISLKEGEGEGFVKTKNHPESERYFAYYKDEEVRELFSDFHLLSSSKTSRVKSDGGSVFLNYLFGVKIH
ncbi:MAG: class I SAM-dependent methyltransferase [Nanoarchaeota archaeon]|nr:class I SAM-dependent methyltransferase [Nanoarchaeota archaeon]